MDSLKMEQKQEEGPPPCFGNEVKFVGHLEAEEGLSECSQCPRENECGEFILFKCSRELMF
jgi:hypothetical protein